MAILRNSKAERWDWDLALAERRLSAFPGTRISFGDLDAEVEVNCRFLVVEGKREGEDLKQGQRIAMERRVHTGRTCLLVFGDPPTDIKAMQHFGVGGIVAATWEDFAAFCAEWRLWALRQVRPLSTPSPFRPTKKAEYEPSR